MSLRTLFLHPPSYEGFDGGAGARYQARREIRSFWYPTWLAQPAALVPGSRLVDAPPEGLTLDQVAPLARQYDHVVMHTSTPSFGGDVRVAERLKQENPRLLVAMVGAHVAVLPEASLRATRAVDWVGVGEFDYACAEVAEGRPLAEVRGIAYREGDRVRFTAPRPPLEDMDALPFVVDVYQRDLTIENYFIGYLLHPYVSLYTGRGCRSKCTFCLWPQTVGGHRYRVRSPENVEAEMARAKRHFPQVREFFFDDDTFTDDLPRAEEIARRLGRLGLTWSCNAKANVPRRTLEILRDNGLRLLLVGYESGSQQILNNIRKGVRLDVAREFTRNAKALGIAIHGTFILGLPGETPETIRETIRYACEIEPDTVQVSLAAPYPGTELYRQAQEQGWLPRAPRDLVSRDGVQVAALDYPGLPQTEIFASVEAFYRRFYFRPRKIVAMVGGMLRDPAVMRRRLREGVEFLRFLRARRPIAGEPRPVASDVGGLMRVLFVCRGNICRSRVAEQIFQVLTWRVGARGDHEARSAGVDPDSGGRAITKRDVAWADVICVMEAEHEAYIRKHWPGQVRKIRVLGIPDVYEPDDVELRDRLTEVVRGLLAEGSTGGPPPGMPSPGLTS